MRNAGRHHFSRHGVTLIELLVAILISGIVVAILFTVYATTQSVIERQEANRSGPGAAIEALDLLSRDLACGLTPYGDDRPGFLLAPPPSRMLPIPELSFFTAVRDQEDSDLIWHSIRHVTIRAEKAGGAQFNVQYITRNLTGPDSEYARTNLLLSGVLELDVRAFDGTEWVKSWPSETSDSWPSAVRLNLFIAARDGEKNYSTEVFIPTAAVLNQTNLHD